MAKIIINSKTYGIKEVLIDDQYEVLLNRYSWHIIDEKNGNFYAYTNLNRTNNRTIVSMHRFLHPEWQIVDHINGNGLDNRECNLRGANSSQNNKNKTKRQTGTASKYKGVYRGSKNKSLWMAAITINGKRTHLGYFTEELAAATAYNVAARQHYGIWAKVNNIIEIDDWEKYRKNRKKSSKYKYITWDNKRKLWTVRYKGEHLGRFKTEEEAHEKILQHEGLNGSFYSKV